MASKRSFGGAQLSTVVDSRVGSDPPASTDQKAIDSVESAAGVAVPSGAVNLPVVVPGTQVVGFAELEHAITVVVCLADGCIHISEHESNGVPFRWLEKGVLGLSFCIAHKDGDVALSVLQRPCLSLFVCLRCSQTFWNARKQSLANI